ncbi:hypothetical protein FKP32DRAFT_1598189 [Trametes sanguinea]|nr:hypothetical protein FKP32DRAFT_1598189 [Trametes sanguinea]
MDGTAQAVDKNAIPEVTEELQRLIPLGPSTDPLLQVPATYPPLPVEPEYPNEHYVLGWELSPARKEYILEVNDIPLLRPDGSEWPEENYQFIICGMTGDYAQYYRRSFLHAVSLDARPPTDAERDEWPTRPDMFPICFIDVSMARNPRARPTQAQYEWLAKAMGGEPQWHRWLYSESAGRSLVGR